MSNYSAVELVRSLDLHIIGQESAKKAVSIAVMNRARRANLPEDHRREILPKNILLVGPSGVGKTEIARRLAELVKAPFLKVEATKFTEVGYVGQDVERIIKDLVEVAVRSEQELAEEAHKKKAESKAFKVLKALLKKQGVAELPQSMKDFKENFWAGVYDNVEVAVDLPGNTSSVEIIVPPGLEEMTQQIEQLFKSFGSDKSQNKNVSASSAYKLIYSYELDKSLSDDDIIDMALDKVQNNGMVFLDEIDKLVAKGTSSNSDISRGGVQRDLLPLLEGTTVSTKYGPVKTDHILFIASGAFLDVKPTDLASELQGRLPVVVRLSSLAKKDLSRILVEPKSSIVNQYKLLLTADGIDLSFTDEAVVAMADMAFYMNKEMVDIGARRLAVIIEKVLEPILYSPPAKKSLVLDEVYVSSQVKPMLKARDDERWVL